MSANLNEDSVKFYPFPRYTLFLLPKYRQVASGILIGVRNELIADFKGIKSMGTSIDKSEIVKIQLWKEDTLFKIFDFYIPPYSISRIYPVLRYLLGQSQFMT
ncbi:hypothetical protein NPIL_594561 [Nephila pilipes]|uniref:Uncharacterized protein n=1 Tax=Nephila pilipes TaxID=299642 RepID=A0A8X6JK74_NEPPI|nr:hypothetical protein NPIL_594561 [Nephila pilipes]